MVKKFTHTAFFLFCAAIVFVFVFFLKTQSEENTSHFQTAEINSSRTSNTEVNSNREICDKLSSSRVIEKNDDCVELSYSNLLSIPGKSKSNYDCKTSIEVKVNDKEIVYYTVSVNEGFLSGRDFINVKELKFYTNSNDYVFYSLCNDGSYTPFETDAVYLRFYNSDRQQVYSYNISVSSDQAGNYFLSRASHTVADS